MQEHALGFTRCFGGFSLRGQIERVAADGKAGLPEVGPDLVGDTGKDLKFQEGKLSLTLHDARLRERGFAAGMGMRAVAPIRVDQEW